MSQETASVLGNSYRIYSLKYIPYTHSTCRHLVLQCFLMVMASYIPVSKITTVPFEWSTFPPPAGTTRLLWPGDRQVRRVPPARRVQSVLRAPPAAVMHIMFTSALRSGLTIQLRVS